MRLIAAVVLLLLAGLAARAENPPDSRPFLRIEAGMHTAPIKRIGVSADGRLLATGSDDKTVRLWSLPDGRLLRTFRLPLGEGNDGKVYAAALSPDGRLVAAGGWDAYRGQNGRGKHFVYIYDTVSGMLMKRLGPLPNVIHELAFSRDGLRLAAGLGLDNGIRVWTLPFDSPPQADKEYKDAVYGLSFDLAGRLAATSYDGNVRLYDPGLARIGKAKAPGGQRPYGIAFSPDGDLLAVGYNDSTRVDVLKTADLSLSHTADTGVADNGDLITVAWSADGTALFAGGTYSTKSGVNPVIRWSEAGRGPSSVLGGPFTTIRGLKDLPDGGIVFGGSDPAFGIFGRDGKRRLFQDRVTADLRDKRSGHFWASADGARVWFGLKQCSEDLWHVDLARLASEAAPTPPTDAIEPQTQTLKIEDWINSTEPKLDGKPLPLDDYEMSRSLAIAPDAKSFILGADWGVVRFDATGQEVWRTQVPGSAWGVNLSLDGSIVIAAVDDGTIRSYRALDGKELLAFFVHVPDKRWIAWTPSGYYAASLGGEDLIGWHVNGKTWDEPSEFFAASRFRDRFYRPDIVQLVLKTRDEARAVQEANNRARRTMEEESLVKIAPAVIEIVADPRGLEARDPLLSLQYRLRTPSGRAVTRIEAQIDGRPVEARGMAELPVDEALQVSVPIPPRDVTVSLIAWTGEQASEAASIAVKWTGPVKAPPKSKLYAVLVGVSAYDDRDLALAYADDDARALDKLLLAQEGRGFAEVETRLLIDKDASEDAIEEALDWLNDSAGPDDTAVVFMAGHGFTDADQKFYFLPVGGNPAKLRSTGISGATLRDVLGSIEGKAIFLIDACRSGKALDGGLGTAFTGFVNELSSAENGVVMFAASTGLQLAVERADWGHGAFTKALLEGLGGRADYEKDGSISAGELNVWLAAEVRRLTEGTQTPVMVAPRAVTEFALATVL